MTDTVHMSRFIAADPETVFSYFTTSDRWLKWQGVEGVVELRPDGQFRVVVTGKDHVAKGSFLTVDPPRRLVFTWGWEGSVDVPPGSTVVDISLRPQEQGTVLTLTHRDLPGEAKAPHTEGWTHYLGRLGCWAEGTDPGPDPWVSGD